MKSRYRVFLVVALAMSVGMFASGCAKKKVKSDEAAVAPMESAVQDDGMKKGIADEGMATKPESLDSAAASRLSKHVVLEGRTHGPMVPVYFDFDRSNIRDDQRERIEKNAAFIKSNSSVTVQIEGNCDERGTNEYNMALGERRAQSAKKYLVNLGVAGNRLQTLSYGEERPLLFGHDELSWAQNRRDDFLIVD